MACLKCNACRQRGAAAGGQGAGAQSQVYHLSAAVGMNRICKQRCRRDYSRGFSAGDGYAEHSVVSRQRGGLPGRVGVHEVVDNRLSQGRPVDPLRGRCRADRAAVPRNHPQARDAAV